MINLLNRYFFNYIFWWYVVEAPLILGNLLGKWVFLMNMLNILPMLKNLFQPLYQDYTRMGRLIAFPIRFTWVFFGLVIELLLLPVIALIFCLYLILPLTPVYGILSYLSNIWCSGKFVHLVNTKTWLWKLTSAIWAGSLVSVKNWRKLKISSAGWS